MAGLTCHARWLGGGKGVGRSGHAWLCPLEASPLSSLPTCPVAKGRGEALAWLMALCSSHIKKGLFNLSTLKATSCQARLENKPDGLEEAHWGTKTPLAGFLGARLPL